MEFNAEDLLGPQGLLQAELPAYEYRHQQIEMASLIFQALHAKEHAIIEAGTGVGKSLAYLLPLIYYTAEAEKRAVVATHTINLQEQLFQKDIPFLQKMLPFDFRVEIFKGRGNYLCLRRWQEMESQLPIDEKLDELRLWVQTTKDGDLSTAPFSLSPELAAAIRSEKESCSDEACAHYPHCFYWKLRNRLSHAHLIITNQALLLANLRAKGRVLPPFQSVVIDEAHNLEEVATRAFSLEIRRSSLVRHYRLGNQLLASLRGFVLEFTIQDIQLALEALLKEATQYFHQIAPFITGYTLSLTAENKAPFTATTLLQQLGALEALLLEIDLEDEEVAALASQYLDATKELQDTLGLILSGQDEGFVYWAEIQNGEPVLIAAPIRVDHILEEELFQETASVILTSATLSTNQSFTYIQKRLGLPAAEKLILGSPFDYAKQALLCVPLSAQHPNNPRFPKEAAFSILQTAAATQGSVLVLFTSYRLMDEIADLIAPKLTAEGYLLFKQGERPRQALIQDFQAEEKALLFGTDSFWEGIDVPGDALKAVVITRLPFAVPNRPVTAARLQAIEADGGNPFFEYSVPQAILRLKQGFGRLIRSSRDRGGIVILDQRILQSSYGPQFLASLPPAPFSRDLEDLRRLFGN